VELSSWQQAVANLITARKELQYALNRRLVGPQSQSGGSGGETLPLLLSAIECQFAGCPSHSPGTSLTLCMNSVLAAERGCAQCSVLSVY
jgi:hypothetical protein